jgi:RHS repeat-associated protein
VSGIEEFDVVTEYHYDFSGNLDQVRLPNCVADEECEYSFQYAYDSVNRLTEVRDSLGNKLGYEYDVEGNRTREEYSNSRVAKFTNFNFDDYNRLAEIHFDDPPPPPNLPTEPPIFHQIGYLDDGTQDYALDPGGHVTTFAYDDLKRLRTSTVTVGSETLTTTYEYDEHDNLISVTDPNGLVTTHTYGDLGWTLSTTSPDTGTTVYEYDKAGNLTESTDANEIAVGRSYDELNRLIGITYPDSSLDVTYGYDSGLGFGIGRRSEMNDPSGHTFYGYDHRGLLIEEQKVIEDRLYGTVYDYDRSGNLTLISYPTSEVARHAGVVTYEYDSANRVTKIETDIDGDTATVASDVHYAPFGPRTGLTFGNSLVDSRTYDSRYRVGEWTLGGLLNYTQTFDYDSNLLGRTDSLDSAFSRSFAYDEIHRLTVAAGPWGAGDACSGSTTYAYDKNGNRTCKGEASTATTYSYTSGTNRLESSTGAEIASYEYDASGNTTDDDGRAFHYNDASRMVRLDEDEEDRYVYDGLNRRVVKYGSEGTTLYFYDPAGRLLTEMLPKAAYHRADGKDYMYLDGAPIARVDWSATQHPEIPPNPGIVVTSEKELFYYHADELGTPIMMTDGSAAPVWKAEYLPFGGLLTNAPLISTISNNLRFPGQYFDDETELQQNWFRDYSPKTGRYMEADPIGIAGGTNLFGYVSANPVRLTDRSGLAQSSTCDDSADSGRSGPTHRCDATPHAPPPNALNADLLGNMQEANEHALDLIWFYRKVHGGGDWDYKLRGAGDFFEGFGNFNFGATGFAAGFSLDFLQRQAGFKQERDPMGRKGWWLVHGVIGGEYPYGDQWRDASQGDVPLSVES